MMVAVQSDGQSEQLYVIGGRRQTTLREDADAIPAELGNDRPYLHFYDDVWAFRPAQENGADSWTRKADVGTAGNRGGRAAGTAISVGRSNIVLLSSAKGDLLRKAFGEMGVDWKDFPMHPGL